MKNPLWACSALAISNTEILLIGGKNTNRNGEVHLFNVQTKNWKPLHHMNQLRVSHKSFFIQNKIYVIGGDYDMSWHYTDNIIRAASHMPCAANGPMSSPDPP